MQMSNYVHIQKAIYITMQLMLESGLSKNNLLRCNADGNDI